MKSRITSKALLLVLSVILMGNVTSSINARTINLLDNAFTNNPEKMYNKSTFYKTWECYWKDGEQVPEASRPTSYFSKIELNAYNQQISRIPNKESVLLMAGAVNAGFSEGMPVIVLDYPATDNASDLYYRIPISVPESGEYKLTGSAYIVNSQAGSYQITQNFNFCTSIFSAIFVSEHQPCKKSFKIKDINGINRIECSANGTSRYAGYHMVKYDTGKDTFVKPIETNLQIDKDDDYLCIYAPPTLEDHNTKAVLVLGNLKLEPTFSIPGPEADAVSFTHFSRTIFVGSSYSLMQLGLTSPAGIDLNKAKIEISCDDTEMFEITGSGIDTRITPKKAHSYQGAGTSLPYSTLTVTYDDGNGTTGTARLKLHVAQINQQTAASFDFTSGRQTIAVGDSETGKTPVPISGTPADVIATTSDTGSWNAYLYNIRNDSYTETLNNESANNVGTNDTTLPDCSYVEGQGWTINFGDQVREYRLRLESNMEQSHYKDNPAYVLQELWLNVDKADAENLSVSSMFNDNGNILYKELEPDIIGDEHFYVGYDGALDKEICIKASGTLVIRKIDLSFVSNFTIPTPGFMNVDNKTSTYITLALPKDDQGNSLWDENALQLQYLITKDETEETQVMSESAYGNTQETTEAAEPQWTNYTKDETVAFNKGQKLTARTLHPHGMISAPASIGYYVITGVEDIESEKTQDVRYFTLQGIETDKPASGPYIEVREGKATKRIAT